MPTGYCTVDGVRRVLQEAEFAGALAESDNRIVVDAIAGVSETIEKATDRFWYAEESPPEDDHSLVPTSPSTRDDEHDIPRHGALVHGDSEIDRHRHSPNSDALLEAGPRYERRRRRDWSEPKREIRIATGDLHDEDVPAYTRITFDRKDVQAVNELHIINADGAYDDWAADDTDYDGGVGNQHRGKDWWVRVNNGGVTELYLDVHAMDDDLASLANAVYVDIDYGHEGIPDRIARGTALLSAYEIVDDELVAQVPENARYIDVETKAERWGSIGVSKLEPDIEDEDPLEVYR